MLKQSRTLIALWVLTAIFCIGLVFNLIPALRGDVPWLPGDSGWVWTYEPPRWLWVIPCFAGVGIYILGVVHLLNQETDSRYPLRLILWTFCGAAILPLLLMTLEARPLYLLFTRSASTLTGGYQYGAVRITDLGDTLRHWTQYVEEYRKQVPLGGIALSPPGLAAVYYSVGKGFEAVPPLAQIFGGLVRPLECQNFEMLTWTDAQMASAWPEIYMPLWAALSVAPLYKLGTSIFNKQVARWAIALWPIVPGMNIFSPRFNTFYVLMTLVMLVVLWRGLDRKRWLWIFVAGFITSIGIYFNLSVIPMGLIGGLTILGHWVYTRSPFSKMLINLIAFGVGSASVWAIYWLLSGVSPMDIVGLGLSLHYLLDRPYIPWLFMHPYDMFLFVGLPIAALALWRLIRTRLGSRADVFAAAGGLAVLIMVVSGTARGETGRVWLFFSPIWILLAAEMMQRFKQHERQAVLVMQGLCLLSMAMVLRANFTTLNVPVTMPSADHPPMFTVNAQFIRGDDKVTLVGLSVDKTPSEVTLDLHWRADSSVKNPYVLALVPVPPDKSELKSIEWVPNGWEYAYPPSCWLPGQEFIDKVTIPLGANPQSGDWLFSLGISVAGQVSTQVGIGPVNIPAP
jgi:hypothetical protein